jgi:hypothetical protein
MGCQAGGQAFSQMVFLEGKRACDELPAATSQFGAGVSAVAITAGVQVSAGPASGAQAKTCYPKDAMKQVGLKKKVFQH